MKKITKIISVLALVLLLAPAAIAEEEEEEFEIFGMEGEELLNLGSGILAIILFGITFIAYRRTKRSRLLFVSLAFFLFAVKGFISGAELFIGEFDWGDPATAILEFAILLSFFWGIMKK